MSQLQRIIVRMGNEANVPALKEAELGWDIDTHTMRVGNETNVPWKILTTGSTGTFDFSNATVIFGETNISDLNGMDLSSLDGSPGLLVRTSTSGVFASTEIVSTDGSVSIQNGLGLNGPIDLSVDPESISLAIAPIIEDIADLKDNVAELSNRTDTLDSKVDSLITLSGVAANSTNLGTFSGSIIADNQTVKDAIQALETALENVSVAPDALGIYSNTSGDLTIQLMSGSTLELPLATEDTAGIISGTDKAALETVKEVINSGGLTGGVTGWESVETEGHIQRAGDDDVVVPLATDELAGLMSPVDKIALSSATTGLSDLAGRVDDTELAIDQLNTDVQAAQSTANSASTVANNAAATASTAQGVAVAASTTANTAKETADNLAATVTAHTSTLNNHEGRITTLEGSSGSSAGFLVIKTPYTTVFDQSFTNNATQSGMLAISNFLWPKIGIVQLGVSSFSTSGPTGCRLTARLALNGAISGGVNYYIGSRVILTTDQFIERNMYSRYMFTIKAGTDGLNYLYYSQAAFASGTYGYPVNSISLGMPLDLIGSLPSGDTTIPFIATASGLSSHTMRALVSSTYFSG